MNMQNISPIGIIHTDFKEKFGIPRQSGRAPSAKGVIEFFPPYSNVDAFRGLEEYSHIWILFDFSLAHRERFSATVRPPRLGGNERKGVFATRSPFRPNSIGLSSVSLEHVEITSDNKVLLHVLGVDILDSTPIYDVKPYIPSTDCHQDAKASFSAAHENDKLTVEYLGDVLSVLPANLRKTLTDCLEDDPRPSYQDDPKKTYGMMFSDYEIKFKVENNILTVIGITKKENS